MRSSFRSTPSRTAIRLLAAAALLAAATTHAATFTVTRGDDPAGGTCAAGDCSLRNAILAANTATGADTIAFAVLPGAGGIATIAPTTALPAITGDDTTVDGFTQAGASPGVTTPNAFAGTIKVLIEGAGAAGSPAPAGLRLVANRATVRGLAIRGFAGPQIDITGSNNLVRGNLVGVSPDGAVAVPLPAVGVRIAGGGASAPRGNFIGGANPLNHRNVIGGHGIAVLIENAGFGSSNLEENRVSDNFINVALDGKAPLRGEHGVVVRNSRNIRIGTASSTPFADANDIGGVTGPESFGIVISGGSRVFVDSNWIAGTRQGVPHTLGTGVFVTNGASEVFVQANLIFAVRNNGIEVRDGSAAPGATSALFERNSVLSVGGLAFDLNGDGPTPNDALDADVGPNRLVNTPTLTAVRSTASDYLLDFTVNAEPNQIYNVEAFAMNRTRASGGLLLAKNPDPRSMGAVVAIFTQSGGGVTTNASGIASGTLTIPRFSVVSGYTVGANLTRALTSGCCLVSGEALAITTPTIPDGTILVFDHASDDAAYDDDADTYANVSVLRKGSTAGAVSVTIDRAGGASTTPGIPFGGITLSWADGDATPRSFAVGYDDFEPQRGRIEAASLRLIDAVGAVIGAPGVYTLHLYNATDAELIVDAIFGDASGSFEDRSAP